jgi:cytochrome b involved in lipid metabolism
MQNKSTSIIIGIIIIILIIVAIALSAQRTDTPPGTVEPTGTAAPFDISTPTTTSPVVGTSTATTTMKSYTLAEITMHSTQQDCWTTINGGVYNVTPFITQHPGGVANIMKVCGKDGTAIFTAKHSTQEKPNDQLAKLKIGVLAQ